MSSEMPVLQSTVWNIPGIRVSKAKKEDCGLLGHGTQKPCECMARPMRNHGAEGDLIYDPFLSSGTSIIAAEQCGRVCCGLELSPAYCDIIVARFEKFTGRKAERITAGA